MKTLKEEKIDEMTFDDVDCLCEEIAARLDPPLANKLRRLPGMVHTRLMHAFTEAANPNLCGEVRLLEKHGFDEQECFAIISACPAHRYIDHVEIDRAVCEVFNGEPSKLGNKWPESSETAIENVLSDSSVRTVKGLVDKYEMEGDGTTMDTVPRLFNPDQILAYSKGIVKFDQVGIKPLSKRLDKIQSLDGCQLVCPNPRTKLKGDAPNKKGNGTHPSAKCADNDGRRRYIVTEFDKLQGEPIPKNTQAAIICHLAKFAPLVMVILSGGKSLHAWFDCRDISERDLKAFMSYAVFLGADKTMWTKSQWCRMPGATRINFDKDGKRLPNTLQKLLVCRPESSKANRWDIDDLPAVDDGRAFPKPMTGAEMKMNFPEPPAEVIRGVLGEAEKLQLSASSKAGKTWAMLYLAQAIATGGEWFGFECVKGKVLFLNFELGEARLKQRIDRFGGLDNVDFLNFRGMQCDWAMIKKGLASLETKYAMIILDPIYKMLGDGDENSNGDIAKLLFQVEQVATDMGAAVGYSHHFSKGNKSSTEQIDRQSGAGTWGRDPDALLTLTPHELGGSLVLESTLRNYATPRGSVWRFDFPHFVHQPDEDASKLKKAHGGGNKKGSFRDAVEIMSRHSDGLRMVDLAKLLVSDLEVSDATARRYVKDAIQKGKIEERDKTLFPSEKPDLDDDDLASDLL